MYHVVRMMHNLQQFRYFANYCNFNNLLYNVALVELSYVECQPIACHIFIITCRHKIFRNRKFGKQYQNMQTLFTIRIGA